MKSEKIGLNIIGAARRDGSDREINDYYATNPRAITDLLQFESIAGYVWENACGEGNLSKELEKINTVQKLMSSDLIDRGYGEAGVDFLQNPEYHHEKTGVKPDWIITNPPYKDAGKWAQRSLEAVSETGKVALLLKLVFLEGQKRYHLFQNSPLKKVCVYSRRLGVYKNNIKTKNPGIVQYAWFIWDKSYTGDTIINWIF